MSDHDGWDDDPELRARLRAADPASALPPADPTRVARLLEETMNGPTDTEVQHETRETGTHDRSPLTWLVAAAAIALIAGAALFGLLRHDFGEDHVPAATSPTVTRLQAPAPAAYRARCMVPTAQALSRQTVAFDGTVKAIAGGVVTLQPTHFYTGDATDLVRVEAPAAADLRALIQSVKFENGGRYLVSASDGTVTICGFSASYTPQLAALYAQAFPAQG